MPSIPPQRSNPQQQAVALWLAIEERGGRPTREAVAFTLRRCFGFRFRDAELVAWLQPFRHMPAHNGHATIKEGACDGHEAAHASARAAKVSLVSSKSYASRKTDGPSDTSESKEGDKTTKSRSLRLPFDRDLMDRRHAILKAVWGRVQPFIQRSTTWTDWRTRNARIAESFARGGYTPEQIVYAWERASEREPVRELSIVQRFLERVETYDAVGVR